MLNNAINGQFFFIHNSSCFPSLHNCTIHERLPLDPFCYFNCSILNERTYINNAESCQNPSSKCTCPDCIFFFDLRIVFIATSRLKNCHTSDTFVMVGICLSYCLTKKRERTERDWEKNKTDPWRSLTRRLKFNKLRGKVESRLE